MIRSDIHSVCVFCGSSSDVDSKYMDLARLTGQAAAAAGLELIYGGGRVGLMGVMADAALETGGKVTGVIPRFLKDREIAHEDLTCLHITETMHERQMKMAELAQAFMILPGGLGTLAEFFEILTWKQVGLHDKEIAIINAGRYWDKLLAAVKYFSHEKFLHASDADLFRSFEDPVTFVDFLTDKSEKQ